MWDFDLKVNRKLAHPILTLFWLWVFFSSHNTETAGSPECPMGATVVPRIQTVDGLVKELESLLKGPEVNQSIGQRVINISSNFMWAGQMALSANSKKLIGQVDEVGSKLVVDGESKLLSNSLALLVKEVNGTNFPGASFSIFNITNLQVTVPSIFESYLGPLGSVVLPPSLTRGLSPEDQKRASRVQFTFYQTTSFFQDKALGQQRVISAVLGCSVANLSITNLTEDIRFTLKNTQPKTGNNVRCVFWNVSLNDVGGWSSVGCRVLNSTEEQTACSCNHLANFAILSGEPFREDHSNSDTTNCPTPLVDLQDNNAANFVNESKDASELNSSQVGELVGHVENLLQYPKVTNSVAQTVISVVSNLMGGDPPVLSASANRLIRAIDDVGLKLVFEGESAVISNDFMALAVRKVDGTNFTGASCSIFNITNLQLTVHGSISTVPTLGSVVLPTSLTGGLSPEDQKLASRVQFTFYQTTSLFRDNALGNRSLISPVIGSSVANVSITNLTENIQFTLRHRQRVTGNYEVSCVFWNFSQNDGGGGWSSDGCFLLNTTENGTACSCNHLTSFAILLDVAREGVTRPQEFILTFITYIGCGISAILLSLTLLTFLFFQNLRQEIPSKILVQFCLSLFLLNMVFLLDGRLALYQDSRLCSSIAFLLHYFLLTSFTWAGLQALHMYHSIIRVFSPYVRRYMLKFSLVGWGLPFIIVLIVISVDKDNYGLVTYGRHTNGTSADFCWLRNNIAFYVTVVGYFLLLFVLSLIVFIVVLLQLARIKKQNPQNTSPHRSLLTDLRSVAGLVILLGLTWGFALFAWGPLYLPFIYLFTIFNSLQGFFIFVFYCAVKERVCRQWRTDLCPGRSSLGENSGWSWAASQNSNKMSVASATGSDLSPASRGSSVSSGASISSGAAFCNGTEKSQPGQKDTCNH